jgi:sacsin
MQVYNWTDSPFIVSRERLLILDPHKWWSAGGPVYDFVANCENVAVQNQMVAFQSVMENPKNHFKGTIIRLPLRNKLQATRSDIVTRETQVSEVCEVLRQFATEFEDGGLLFMRNVERIGIESTSGLSINIEISNGDEVRL